MRERPRDGASMPLAWRPLTDNGVARRRRVRGICQYLLGIFGVLRGDRARVQPLRRERIPHATREESGRATAVSRFRVSSSVVHPSERSPVLPPLPSRSRANGRRRTPAAVASRCVASRRVPSRCANLAERERSSGVRAR